MKNLLSFIILLALAAVACQPKPAPQEAAPTAETYVIVHGAFADGNALAAAQPLLEAKGQKVVVVNLPGHGADTTAAAQIHMQTYVDYVANIVNQQADSVVLVGHSMAGIIVSGVAERVPNKIKRLVYVAAYLPRNNESLLDLRQIDYQHIKKFQRPAQIPNIISISYWRFILIWL
ncbi:MAG: alpha/beta fold hydrolase [Saprospiraceae bacterium]